MNSDDLRYPSTTPLLYGIGSFLTRVWACEKLQQEIIK